MKKLAQFLFLSTLVLLISCVKDIDFDQVEDFGIEPILKLALVNLEVKQDSKLSSGVYQITHESNFDAFQKDFLKDDLVKLVIDGIVVNQINADFELVISLLDSSKNQLYTFKTIDDLKPVFDNRFSEEINLIVDSQVLSTSIIRFDMKIKSKNGLALPIDLSKSIKLNSSASLYFSID